MRRFISFVVVLCFMMVLLPASSYASNALIGDTTIIDTPLDYWDWFYNAVGDLASRAGDAMYAAIFDDYCEVAPNHRHSIIEQRSTEHGNVGLYYVCEYCAQTFGEIAEPAYNDYVSDLPANGYTSTGGLLWSPDHDCFAGGYYFTGSNAGPRYDYCPHYVGSVSSTFSYGELISDCSSLFYTFVPNTGSQYVSSFSTIVSTYSGVAPISGFYKRLNSPIADVSFLVYNGSSGNRSFSCAADSTLGTRYNAGAVITYGFDTRDVNIGNVSYVSIQIYRPVYSVTPDASLTTSINNTYNTNTRTTSIQGDLAYYDVSGTLNLSPSTSIVNENDNSVYNPVTNTTTDISGWSYDYSTRTYDLSTTTGDTITVTYGDENITINEGGETYNIYYVTQVEAPPHVHSYSGTITTQPGCVTTGVKTYTCAECNDTYTEPVPALGHDWQIKTQVQTEYDNEGELIQQGYTIYKCSRCGEEYRSDDSVNPSPPSTAPPSGGGGGGSGGDDGGLADYASDKLSSFSRFWEIIISFFTEFPQKFEDVTNLLVAAVPYVPEEIMYLIEFGIAMAVLVGVFKLLFR